jgi:hypothetical protein
MTDRNEPIASLQTPCVRNCCLGDDDICLGCHRSLSEILRWSEASETEQREILVRCRLRYEQRHGKDSRDVT